MLHKMKIIQQNAKKYKKRKKKPGPITKGKKETLHVNIEL